MQNNPEIEQIVDLAVKTAQARGHEYMLTEHLLLAMLHHPPFRKCLDKFGVETRQFDEELSAYLDSLVNLIKPGITTPKKTTALERVFNRALTQVVFTGRKTLTTIDLYLAIMAENNSHAHYFLLKYGIKKTEFTEFWQRNYAHTEAQKISADQATEILDEYCMNLTRQAQKNQLEPMIGRSAELEEMITVLARRFKANVLMVGDPGVGKTAIIEGLAQEVAKNNVPEFLKDHEVWSLEIG
jgi:ATP-dependent Clp protease ATP-binding subunit ClpA